MLRWLRRGVRAAGDARGIALVTVAFVLFAVGLMLFGFVFLNQNEATFAGVFRSNTTALGLAEAGIQEGLDRLNTYGRQSQNNGASQFTNSLASSTASPWSSGTVYFEPSVANNPQIFPIRSTATFLGVSRTVRIYESILSKTGTGNVIFGPQITFAGDAHQVTGDSYSQSSATFNQYQKSPLCSAGPPPATATNLVGPQVFAGTYITLTAAGPNTTPPCGAPPMAAFPTSFECAVSGTYSEVPPTTCAGAGGRAANVPVNWHPMTPIGMPSADFTFVMNAVPGQLPVGVTNNVQATQGGVGVTYTPASYTPSYWTTEPATNGKVMLLTASVPFCVNPSAGYPAGLQSPVPFPNGGCNAGYHYYGSFDPVTGLPQPTRFLDWGIVNDDLNNRAIPQTFYQAPACTAPCANPGNQNGIRYIPAVPFIDVTGKACLQNFNPGHTVFDPVIARIPPISCPNPPTTTIAASPAVVFDGLYNNPEALIIDNAGGAAVTISPSKPGPGSCGSDFTTYNVGIILATGDLAFAANTVFSGYIYTPGNITASGTVVFQGGVFSANVQNNVVNHWDSTGNVSLCAGAAAALPDTSLFFTFKTIAWEDLPGGQP